MFSMKQQEITKQTKLQTSLMLQALAEIASAPIFFFTDIVNLQNWIDLQAKIASRSPIEQGPMLKSKIESIQRLIDILSADVSKM